MSEPLSKEEEVLAARIVKTWMWWEARDMAKAIIAERDEAVRMSNAADGDRVRQQEEIATLKERYNGIRCPNRSRAWGCRCDLPIDHEGDCCSDGDSFAALTPQD